MFFFLLLLLPEPFCETRAFVCCFDIFGLFYNSITLQRLICLPLCVGVEIRNIFPTPRARVFVKITPLFGFPPSHMRKAVFSFFTRKKSFF